MGSNHLGNSKLLTAGGILSIVAEVFLICSGVFIVVLALAPPDCSVHFHKDIAEDILLWSLPFVPQFAEAWMRFSHVLAAWVSVGDCLVLLGIAALAGGISSIGRRSYGLSLAEAICALPSTLLGILAVAFVALGKREFRAENWMPKRHSDRHNISSVFCCYDIGLITM